MAGLFDLINGAQQNYQNMSPEQQNLWDVLTGGEPARRAYDQRQQQLNNWQPAPGQDFGKVGSQALNRDLARRYGYTGSFGQGGFDQFRQSLNQGQNEQIDKAVNLYHNGDHQMQQQPPAPRTLQSLLPYGAEPQLNRALAQNYGYTGPWGQGGWQKYQQSLSPEQQASSNQMIQQYRGQ